jgi:hypothetical protein
MKSTIKLFIAASLVALSLSANAQGLQLSYVSQTTVSSINSAQTSDMLNGVQAGLFYNSPMAGPVSLNYGLSYTYLFSNSATILSTSYTTAHQLDLPIRLVITIPFSDDFRIFAFGGPDFSYALANNTKTSVAGVSVNSDLYGNNSNISQFNLQAGLGVGLGMKNVFLKVGYDWGLLDLNKTDLIMRKTNALTASIGVKF